MSDNINRKTILILGLALSLGIPLLTLLFQEGLRERMGSSFHIIGLSIIGCVLLVLTGYVWDRTMIERLRSLRESAGPQIHSGDEDADMMKSSVSPGTSKIWLAPSRKWKRVFEQSLKIKST